MRVAVWQGQGVAMETSVPPPQLHPLILLEWCVIVKPFLSLTHTHTPTHTHTHTHTHTLRHTHTHTQTHFPPSPPWQIPPIRFVNQKPIYNMQELICFIFLGYIFRGVHLEDLERICAGFFQPLYASVHTSICEAIKQALTTHVNCVSHNKLYAYLQKI